MSNLDSYFEDGISKAKQAKLFRRAQLVLVVLGYAFLAVALIAKFTNGFSVFVTPLAFVGGVICLISYILGKKSENLASEFTKVQKTLKQLMITHEAEKQTRKIQLSIGFANLSDGDFDSIASEDVKVLTTLFARIKVAPRFQIPKVEVLFLYAHLNEDGTIKQEQIGNFGVRQVVELTNASIVVLASPNSQVSIQNAITLHGQKTANIIFTLDRNGKCFSQFFYQLFEKMCSGNEMLSAWVELSPQNPRATSSTNSPQTILVAEGGKVLFPN